MLTLPAMPSVAQSAASAIRNIPDAFGLNLYSATVTSCCLLVYQSSTKKRGAREGSHSSQRPPKADSAAWRASYGDAPCSTRALIAAFWLGHTPR